jgi:hypothetical protein
LHDLVGFVANFVEVAADVVGYNGDVDATGDVPGERRVANANGRVGFGVGQGGLPVRIRDV